MTMEKTSYIYLLTCSLVVEHFMCGTLEKITRYPQNFINDFSGYKDISILDFKIPEDTIAAEFRFKVIETKAGGFGNCLPKNVSVYLKSGSIPLIHPDGARVHAKLLENRRQPYGMNLTSDGYLYGLKISTPTPGYWYAIAFCSWIHPNTKKITQQGLIPTCYTIMDAELLTERAHITMDITNNLQTVNLNSSKNTAIIKFLLPKEKEFANVSLISSCGNFCEIAVSIVAENELIKDVMNDSKTTLSFRPHLGSLHYLTLRLLSGDSTNITASLLEYSSTVRYVISDIPVTRKSFMGLILPKHEYLQGKSIERSLVNVTIVDLTVMDFHVDNIYDIGKLLYIGIKLLNKTENVMIVGCISTGTFPRINTEGNCIKGDSTTTPDLLVDEKKPMYINIPYPEPGAWYLSMKAYRKTEDCPCLKKCEASYCKICACLKETSLQVQTSFEFSACVEGCNTNGNCHYYYKKGGSVMTTCVCKGKYRGFDCADDSFQLTAMEKKKNLLLLSLSNLAFIGSVYVALHRKYYTESVAYVAVMFSSLFYHACEEGENFDRICSMSINVLQFCDFFNALLSIWVTLVAMASLGPTLTGFFQLSGAIVLAFAVELNRTALWVFLLPTIAGLFLVIISWSIKFCLYHDSKCLKFRYISVYLPCGFGVVIFGLICFAFLQTQQNYYITHSCWHLCSAISIILLLPEKEKPTRSGGSSSNQTTI